MNLWPFVQQHTAQGTQVMKRQDSSRDHAPDWPPNLSAIVALIIEQLDLLSDWTTLGEVSLAEVRQAAEAGSRGVDADWSDSDLRLTFVLQQQLQFQFWGTCRKRIM